LVYESVLRTGQTGREKDEQSSVLNLSRYQKGKTNLDFTEARDSEWQWHQLGRMQVCTSLQIDNHASNPPVSFLQAGCPSCYPTNSVKALEASDFLMRQTGHTERISAHQNDILLKCSVNLVRFGLRSSDCSRVHNSTSGICNSGCITKYFKPKPDIHAIQTTNTAYLQESKLRT